MAVFRFGKPHRHGTLQRALTAHGAPLAGDDENVPQSALMGAIEKIEQHRMGLALKHTVQIDARFERQGDDRAF